MPSHKQYVANNPLWQLNCDKFKVTHAFVYVYLLDIHMENIYSVHNYTSVYIFKVLYIYPRIAGYSIPRLLMINVMSTISRYDPLLWS